MNLEQFKLAEKIKLSYLMHRGDAIKVSSDLSLPLDIINKYIKKFKKQEERSVSELISNNLMQTILLGYNSRVSILYDTLNSLKGREQLKISVCCEAPVIAHPEQKDAFLCAFCSKNAIVKLLDKEGIINLKLELLAQLRDEDKALVDFAGKMGYTQKEETPVQKIQQNFLVLNDTKDLNNKIVQDISNLGAIERDILAEKLQKEISLPIEVPSEKK